MVEFIGMLKVKVIKGTDLAVRDIKSSDPYVVLNLGTQVGCFSCHIFPWETAAFYFYLQLKNHKFDLVLWRTDCPDKCNKE